MSLQGLITTKLDRKKLDQEKTFIQHVDSAGILLNGVNHIYARISANREQERQSSRRDKRCDWWDYGIRTRIFGTNIDDLSMPTFAAFVVTNSRKSASRMWPSSQNRRIRQNLSVLCNDPLIWRTLTFSLNWFNLCYKLSQKCWDWCQELQNMTALFTQWSHKNSETRFNPLET